MNTTEYSDSQSESYEYRISHTESLKPRFHLDYSSEELKFVFILMFNLFEESEVCFQ